MFHVLWQRRFLSRFWFLCFEDCCTTIYCRSTKLQNSVCMVGVQTCPPYLKKHLHPHFFVSFQHITFKLGIFTTLMCLFQQCQWIYANWSMPKSEKIMEGSIWTTSTKNDSFVYCRKNSSHQINQRTFLRRIHIIK